MGAGEGSSNAKALRLDETDNKFWEKLLADRVEAVGAEHPALPDQTTRAPGSRASGWKQQCRVALSWILSCRRTASRRNLLVVDKGLDPRRSAG